MTKISVPLVAVAILVLILCYSYIIVSFGSIEPLGRLGYVKLANHDMYPGHPHSELLAKYAEDKGSKCILVVHFAGSSNYRSYIEDDDDKDSELSNLKKKGVYIIEVAYIDTHGAGSINLGEVNYLDSLKVALFGVPDGRYNYMSDGKVYNTYDEMMDHVNEIAEEHGQKGPIPMTYHGTVREGNPVITPGCGFPFYFQILTKEYGIIPAYFYTLSGMVFPIFNDPYMDYELLHSSELQYYYDQGFLNVDYKEAHTNTGKYYQNNNYD